MEQPGPSLPAIRCLTKEQAAAYLGIGITLLAELGVPSIKLGRRCVYDRVDLERRTAWLDQTKNGTPRGVPLNTDAVAVLEDQQGKHPQYCFTYRGKPIRWEMTNSAWHTALGKAGLKDFRFHDLRHTWASWHRQAGTSTDELKDLGGWKSRVMVDRYAKFATEHLAVAAARIQSGA